MPEHLFIRNKQYWINKTKESHLLKDACSAPVLCNAILAPLRPAKPTANRYIPDMVCTGGVFNSDGTFYAGHKRFNNDTPGNLECQGSHDLEQGEVSYSDERVLFGGIVYPHFGHMITDCFTRTWYMADHDDYDKVVFLAYPLKWDTGFDPSTFLELLAFDDKQIEVVAAPTRYREMIVPDESFISFKGYMPEYAKTFRLMASNVKSGPANRKIYLSRRKFQTEGAPKKRGIINEEYFENFYRRRGYEIVYPETLSVREQIQLVAEASDLVTTLGTMSHLELFAGEGTRVTIHVRSEMILVQHLIDKACGLRPYYVESSTNPLPVSHMHGPYLMLPNRYFRQYLDSVGEPYSEDELQIDSDMPSLVYEFLSAWGEMYRKKGATRANGLWRTRIDSIIKSINDAVYDSVFTESDYSVAPMHDGEKRGLEMKVSSLSKTAEELKQEKYRLETRIADLNEATESLRLENDRLSKRLSKIEHSRTWIYTAPIRKLAKAIKKLRRRA